MKRYEVFEHTADVGIRAFGEDLNQAFENAASGMFDIITDLDKVEPVGEYDISIKEVDLAQLVVDWLSELLYIHSVRQLMLSKFKAHIQEKEGFWHLLGSAQGEEIKEIHPYHTEIKAVTHHILKVEKNDGYHIQVLFDI
jgi:SHS2 domain-containing protein